MSPKPTPRSSLRRRRSFDLRMYSHHREPTVLRTQPRSISMHTSRHLRPPATLRTQTSRHSTSTTLDRVPHDRAKQHTSCSAHRTWTRRQFERPRAKYNQRSDDPTRRTSECKPCRDDRHRPRCDRRHVSTDHKRPRDDLRQAAHDLRRLPSERKRDLRDATRTGRSRRPFASRCTRAWLDSKRCPRHEKRLSF